MMAWRSCSVVRVLACLGVLALGLVAGGGHDRSAGERDPALLAYLAMGGAVADLCGDVEHPGLGDGCDACRLLEAAVPMETAQVGRIALAAREAAGFGVALWSHCGVSVGWHPRGPPGPVV